MSAPILSASLLRAHSILPILLPTEPLLGTAALFPPESNYQIGIKCFKGEILPFDSCPPFSAWSFLPCFAVGFVCPTCPEEFGSGSICSAAAQEPQAQPGDPFVIGTGDN